uniref:Uncharacterized protein n=1 Tax=Tanacetum cinerariifolium TaxID=118510 RepID=A0A6L2KYM8_TANCI|nr:hypothetical protein [Tanacetum cinerariifolium]
MSQSDREVEEQPSGFKINWKRDTAYMCQLYTRNRVLSIPNTAYPRLPIRRIQLDYYAEICIFDDTSDEALSCEPTVSPLDKNEIDFDISFDESDDEDYMVIFDENSFSCKIIYVDNLKTDFEDENDKVNMPSSLSPEPTFGYIDDLDFFKDFMNEFPAIAYNDLKSKSDPLIEPSTLRDRLSMVYTGDDGEALFTSHAWRRLFEVRAPLVKEFMLNFFCTCRMSDTEMGLDVADTLCFQLGGARHAEGRKSGAKLSWGHFIGRLAAHFGFVNDQGLRGLSMVVSTSTIATRFSTPDYVIKDRGGGARVTTECCRLVFDSTLVDSSWVPYQRPVRPRTGDAGTSTAPHTNDQPGP